MPAGQRRILYIHHGSGTGGAPLSLGYLIRELDRDRYEPLVCCHPDEDTAIDLFRRFGHEPATWRMVRFQHSEAGWWRPWAWRDWVPLVRWLRGYRASCAALRELLARLTPDVVHLNSITLLPYAKTIRACGPRVVGHIREPAAAGTLGLRRAWLRRRVRRYVDALVFICADNRDRLLGEGATRRQVNHRVIYNFVDFAEFDRGLDRSAARKQLGVADDVPVILFSGGSSSGIKGVLPLVRAIAKVRTHLPNVVCLMPGTQSAAPRQAGLVRRLLRGKLMNQHIAEAVAELDLTDALHPSAFTLDMPTYYAACDVVAVPFTKPHFARAVIEAGAMGKPVVASRIGGVSEVVADGRTGLLVPPDDSQALADGLRRVLNDRELAERLGDAGYEQARTKFAAQKNAADTVAVYDEVFAQHEMEAPASAAVAQ
jgi:glycosyltransferase involved in cell wall biosynthesis